jgi:hypothetical protein
MKTENIIRSFRVPLRYKIAVWLLVLLIIAFGIYLSILYSDWYWLGRFGALIVIASLVLEATGLVQRFFKRVTQVVIDTMPKTVEREVKRNPHLYGLSGNETSEQLKYITGKELKRRAGEYRALAEKAMNRELRKTEFGVASIGTLLWAFIGYDSISSFKNQSCDSLIAYTLNTFPYHMIYL